MVTSFHSHVQRAIKIVGGQTRLANAIGCAQSEVWRLANTAKTIPNETAVAIVRVTNGEVLLSELIPEVVAAVRDELARVSVDTSASVSEGAPA